MALPGTKRLYNPTLKEPHNMMEVADTPAGEAEAKIWRAIGWVDVEEDTTEPEPGIAAEGPRFEQVLPPRPTSPADGGVADLPVEDDYEAQTVEELRDELSDRGLSKSGNKDELVARLRENDREA